MNYKLTKDFAWYSKGSIFKYSINTWLYMLWDDIDEQLHRDIVESLPSIFEPIQEEDRINTAREDYDNNKMLRKGRHEETFRLAIEKHMPQTKITTEEMQHCIISSNKFTLDKRCTMALLKKKGLLQE